MELLRRLELKSKGVEIIAYYGSRPKYRAVCPEHGVYETFAGGGHGRLRCTHNWNNPEAKREDLCFFEIYVGRD
jgi:hypothetical protein